MRVAVMQPYFMPYAGYFRLLATTDLFVAFDCVQFPRRGWVHRNRLKDNNGNLSWLTLPLQKGSRDATRICDLQFPGDADVRWREECRRFPALEKLQRAGGEFASLFFRLAPDATAYIVSGLATAAQVLGIGTPIIRSTTFQIDPSVKGQDRILEICRVVGATEYVNAPGGKELYSAEAFESRGLRLTFLSEYQGEFNSIVERLVTQPRELIREEIYRNLQNIPPV